MVLNPSFPGVYAPNKVSGYSKLVNFGPKSMIKHDVSVGDTHSPVKEVCHR